jgi:hypothetical protein
MIAAARVATAANVLLYHFFSNHREAMLMGVCRRQLCLFQVILQRVGINATFFGDPDAVNFVFIA